MKRESGYDGSLPSRVTDDLGSRGSSTAGALRHGLSLRRNHLRADSGSPEFVAALPLDVRFLVARGLSRRHVWRAINVAVRSGRTPGEVLLDEGAIEADLYYRCLAAELRVPFLETADLVPDPRVADSLPEIAAGKLSFLAVAHDATTIRAAIAPPPARIASVILHMTRNPQVRERVSVTTPHGMEMVRRCQVAIQTLHQSRPLDSASYLLTPALKQRFGCVAGVTACLLWLAPIPGALVTIAVTGFVFIAAGVVRAVAALGISAPLAEPIGRRCPSWDLPFYSVLVPLYQEASVVGDLMAALNCLDYPRARLQILLIVEADDAETRAALAHVGLYAPFEVCVVPAFGPRTKPKALAYGLRAARGDLITVYDAEDRPEPDQLRKVAAIFADAPPELGCVQARLAIDHAAESIFARCLALEYALQFDVLLPWMAKLGLPIRLGGTSNHMRRQALEECGGWDPYNVTEDLDLGIRLLRDGWLLACVDSTTWEEAPLTFRAWRHQRIRWHKGWLQTWFVHMREPIRVLKETGSLNSCVIVAMFTGTLLSLVAHPVFLLLLTAYAVNSAWWPASDGMVSDLVLSVSLIGLVLGYGGFLFATHRAALLRNLRFGWWETLTLPLYWLLMSVVLITAVIELVRRPFHWRKTEHGLAQCRPVTRKFAPGTLRKSL